MEHLSELAASRRAHRPDHTPSLDVRSNAAREARSASGALVLVVEDEAVYGRCLLRTIARCGGTGKLVCTVRDAYEQLASGAPWTGLIVDVLLPDGSGLEFLREARARLKDVPALILTGLRDNRIAAAAFELCATYLVKPVDDVYVESLVHHAFERVAIETDINRVVMRWTARYGLSDAEAAILVLATEGHQREAISLIRSSCASTTKTQIHNLLQKTRDACLLEAVNRVLREALNS